MNLLVCSSNIMLRSDLYNKKLTLIFHLTFSFVGIGAEFVGFAISLSNCSSFWPTSILFYDHSWKAFTATLSIGTLFTRMVAKIQRGIEVQEQSI